MNKNRILVLSDLKDFTKIVAQKAIFLAKNMKMKWMYFMQKMNLF